MSEPASSETNTNENPQSSQAIVDGLREGSLVTESIQKQQEEIMKKMEETIRAAQIKIKKENAQIKQIIMKVQGVTVSLRRMVEESNRILEGNRRLLQKAIQVTENDIIKAYYGNEIRGMARADICPLNDKILFNLMVYSNNTYDSELDLIYFNKKTGKEYLLRENINFEKDSINGNALNPITFTDSAIPYKNELSAPYPNPFNPLTTINFSLINDENNLIINVYDLRGRLVETLYSGFISSGYHSLNWNASDFSSGIYFINMITDKKSFTKKITLLK